MTEDPFAQLGLPPRYEIDRAALQAAYLRKAAALHPDRVTDPLQAAEAAGLAAALNDARAVLEDDEQRADVLLRLLGGPAKEQLNTLPQGFLVDMMQVREDMEEALSEGDEAQRARLEEWAAARRLKHRTRVARLFEEAARFRPSDVLAQIRIELNAWRYIERMIEQLDPGYHRPLEP